MSGADDWTVVCRTPECEHEWQLPKVEVLPGLRCPKCLRPRPVAYPPGSTPAQLRNAARRKQEEGLSAALKKKQPKAPPETKKWPALRDEDDGE